MASRAGTAADRVAAALRIEADDLAVEDGAHGAQTVRNLRFEHREVSVDDGLVMPVDPTGYLDPAWPGTGRRSN